MGREKMSLLAGVKVLLPFWEPEPVNMGARLDTLLASLNCKASIWPFCNLEQVRCP